MAILNFHKRFAGKVKNGRKRQTIRAVRKYPIKVGETLYLYTGLRSNYTRKLREATCRSVEKIEIDFFKNVIRCGPIPYLLWTDKGLNQFAKLDGFKDWEDMKAFWVEKHGVKKGKVKVLTKPFIGTITKW